MKTFGRIGCQAAAVLLAMLILNPYGKQPWKVLKLGILPDAPVSRDHVWYEGPNFGTALYYEPATDTLLFYGGFHYYYIGMIRVQHFSQSQLFHSQQARVREDTLPADTLRSTQNSKATL